MYKEKKICIIIPAYNVEGFISTVIEALPQFIDFVVVVDDASSDKTYDQAKVHEGEKVFIVRHQKNQGVGGATITGFKKACSIKADIIVKMDGDGQMDPAHLTRLLEPIVEEGYCYAKGNRFLHSKELSQMPRHRLFGNFILTFFTKLASGYWNIFDPQNGYIAMSADLLNFIDFDTIARRYFFENDMLVHLNICNCRVKDVPIPAKYGEERSSMKITKIMYTFPWYLLKRFWYRVYRKYVLFNFSPVAMFFFLGTLFFGWGVLFGGYVWTKSILYNKIASTGTVMLSVLPFLVGFDLILQAVILDIQETPK